MNSIATPMVTQMRRVCFYLIILSSLTLHLRDAMVALHAGYMADVNEDLIMHSNSFPVPVEESIPSDSPNIAWLMSYPNSGTSFTMTLTEIVSNFSTASNYGVEVAEKFSVSTPVHPSHPEGPFWEGLSEARGKTVRDLPKTFVLTKTHCGGRCVDCGPQSYVVSTSHFLEECTRTTARVKGIKRRVVSTMNPRRVQRMVHLIRNPVHNVISRFHLSRRHAIRKNPKLAKVLTDTPTGFQLWCKMLDEQYMEEERQLFDASLREVMKQVPCHAEFFRYTQWHNKAREVASLIGNGEPKILTLFYEDYQDNLNGTTARLLDFLELPKTQKGISFRDLPLYDGYFSISQESAARKLVNYVADPPTRELLARYMEQ